MSKKKRIRRDIEKYARMGRYWELLRLLEEEDLAADYAREHKEAWKALIKQALKNERAFEQFLREVESFKKPPGDPDLRFLMLLKDFTEDRGSTEEILQLKGLSPDAEKLRSKVATFDAFSTNVPKLRTLLEKFLREPEKITRRYFEDLAQLLPTAALQTAASRMGEWIPAARRFNHKAAVARGWAGLDYERLKRLDAAMALNSDGLPPALRETLLFPFVHNLAVMCRRLAPTARSHDAARLVRSVPSLLGRLAGEKIDEIERKLLIQRGEWVEEADGEGGSLEQKIPGMSIEEKVSLLSGLRDRVEEGPADSDFGIGDLYDDEEDEDLFDDKSSRAEHLARNILLTHRSILRDLSGKASELPSREKKDLVRVMEPVLLRDVDFILDHVESFDEVVTLLEDSMTAGCAGTRMSLLVMLAGSFFRKTDLRKKAEKHLDRSPPPTTDDMQWLARQWSEFYYPKARTLRPLLFRYGGDKALLSVFSTRLCKLVEDDLLESMLQKNMLRFPFSLMGDFSSPKSKDPGILRQELNDLSEFGVMDPVRQYLRCYAKDRLNLEGNLCWLNALRAMLSDGVWEMALADLKRYGKLHTQVQFLLRLQELNTLLSEKVQAVLLFMEEHIQDFSKLPLETIDPLLNELLDYPEILRDHPNVMVHLNNLLFQRLKAGEVVARPLMERVKQVLLELAKPEKKTSKSRKKRR